MNYFKILTVCVFNTNVTEYWRQSDNYEYDVEVLKICVSVKPVKLIDI